MKVLHVIPSVARRDGGPSIAVRHMTEGLVRRGAEVTVVTTNADGSGTLPVPLGVPIVEDGVEYRYFARTVLQGWKLSLSLARWLRRHVAEYDVVHVHAVFNHSSSAACRAAAGARVPYVVRPLGTLDPWSLGQGSWKKRMYLRLLGRRDLQAARAIHATSEMEREAILAERFSGHVVVIPLGVEVGAAELVHRVPSESRPLRILFLGRLHAKKGVEVVQDAAVKLLAHGLDCEVVVAGAGEADYEAALLDRNSRLGLTPRVRFVGPADEAMKERLFAWADLFVLPSWQENFGISVVEAMAAGLPVVISEQVGIAPEVGRAGAGLVVLRDPAAVAEAIAGLASDAELRCEIGRRAARFARDHYSWAASTTALLALYEQIIP